ncbi:MAG: DNA-protecting protein DprA, partial [Chloroflexi bacterium]|nr:DNA-protecting protein DprA [Chloroflexota bacterium]
SHFGDLETAWGADSLELARAGLDRRSLASLLALRKNLDLDAELARTAGLGLLCWDDPGYPQLLLEIPNPPPLLYLKGQLTEADEWAVAVVGTRRATAYGREVARELSYQLAASGVTIVSGLARGIDSAAHMAALDAGGRTLAVLGCGLDRVYPSENARMAAAIARQGALLSEFAVGVPPESGNFPARNRVISGLTLGTLVVEAGEVSGALITAEMAAEHGRQVFVVPGSILSHASKGANRLIQDGAQLVRSADDILEALNLTRIHQHVEARAALPADPTESLLLSHLSAEPLHVDELRAQCGLPIGQVSGTLAMMELKGMVRQVGGMKYVLAREPRGEYRID